MDALQLTPVHQEEELLTVLGNNLQAHHETEPAPPSEGRGLSTQGLRAQLLAQFVSKSHLPVVLHPQLCKGQGSSPELPARVMFNPSKFYW